VLKYSLPSFYIKESTTRIYTNETLPRMHSREKVHSKLTYQAGGPTGLTFKSCEPCAGSIALKLPS